MSAASREHRGVLANGRLSAVAEDAGLRSISGAIRLPSASNEAWKVGDIVVRISWRGDRERVSREVAVLQHLPESVPHPEVLGPGTTADRTWTLTRWVPGDIAIDTVCSELPAATMFLRWMSPWITASSIPPTSNARSTVLDFEWVRLGPPDLDLQAFLRAEQEAESDDVITRLAAHYHSVDSP